MISRTEYNTPHGILFLTLKFSLPPYSKSMETTGYTCFQTLQYYLSDACEGTVPEQYAEPAGRVTVIGRPE